MSIVEASSNHEIHLTRSGDIAEKEARALISKLFDFGSNGMLSIFLLDPASEDFNDEVAALFVLIKQIPCDKHKSVMDDLWGVIDRLAAENDYCLYGDKAIRNIRQLLITAGEHHLDLFGLLKRVAWTVGCDLETHGINQVFEWAMDLISGQTFSTLWVTALVVSVDEQVLLAEGLSEDVIAWLAQARNSERCRSLLKKTSTGRDVLIAQDLGL